MATQKTAKRPFWYLDGGDAVRAIACLGIVCYHVATGALYATGNLEGTGGRFTWMTGYGEVGHFALRTASLGFYMFFVLSGFLVSAPFVAAFVEGRPRPRLGPFLRNRAVRLVPAAWLLFAFVLLRHGAMGANPGELAAMFTFTDDQVDHPLTTLVGQTWTLRVDMSFYVLVPLAATIGVRLVGTRLGVTGRRRAVWAGVVAAAAVPLTVAALVTETTATTRSPATLMFLFMPGVAIAAALAGRPPLPRMRWAAPVGTALSLAGVLVLIAFPRDQLVLPYKLVIVGSGAAMVLGGLIILERLAGRPWRWMESPVVRWVGRRTYGIYLWHLALMAELVALFGESAHPGRTYLMLLPLVLLATFIVAELSFRFVERPAMRLRDPSGSATAAAQAPPAAPAGPEPKFVPAPAAVPAPVAATKPRRRHVATATPLRGLAVLAVVAFHTTAGALFVTGYLKGSGGTLQPETAFGPVMELVLDALPSAVYLFFALSGFLIARPFVEAFVSGAALPSLPSYARNRVLRIFPAAWLLIALVLFKYGDRGADPGELLSMITLTESYTPHPLESLVAQLWSLKVELSFYLLVPVVSVVLWQLRHHVPETRRKLLIYVLAGAGAVVSLVFCTLEGWGQVQQRTLPWTLIAFMSGVVLAAILVGAQPRPAGRAIRALTTAAFAGGLALALVSGHYGTAPAVTNALATLAVTGVLWGPVVLEVRTGHTWRWLDNRVLAWVGNRSYAIYLFHLVVMAELYPLVSGIEGYKVAYVVLLTLVVVASAAVAEVSWRLVERPALRLKRRSSDPAPPAITAAGLLAPNPWQMTLGERAAMEGLLARLKPALAIEIGTAEGGSTRCLARHCTEIHSFDLVHPPGLTEELPGVTMHTGDSHELLPAFLEQLAAAGRSVDFVLVDGDDSADGVRRDIEDLLASPAVEGAAIVLHDSANDEVRAGLHAAAIEEHPSVAYLDLDFVAGHLSAAGMPYEGQLWGGLGLVIADPAARAGGRCAQPDLFEPAGDLLRVARDVREVPYPVAAA